jgi:hypothetical protein
MAAFDLHEISVGGGTVAMCQLPGRAGDYLSDFNKIVEWKPDLVISLTEPHEIDPVAGRPALRGRNR